MVTRADHYKELASLLCAGNKGDSTAYAAFLGRITPLMRRIVGRRLASADVEDVVQEVLISIHKARHTFDGDRPIVPWMMAIANFRITDHLRKHYSQRRHQAVDIAELENILADVTEDPADHESVDEFSVAFLKNIARF